MTVILAEQTTITAPGARVDGQDLWLSRPDAEAATGWSLKPEGFCKGDLCVPVPKGRTDEFVAGDEINVAALWRHLGQPQARDARGETWVLGTSAATRSAQLSSLEAPDFSLPDLDGRMHTLRDYRGRKVMLVSWASW